MRIVDLKFDHLEGWADGKAECDHFRDRGDSIFFSATEATFQLFALHNICNTYEKGQYIFMEGSQPSGVYFINKGRLKITRRNNKDHSVILNLLQSGDIVGHHDVIRSEKYSVSAVVMEMSEVCFIPADIFKQIIREDPEVNMALMKLLCEENIFDENEIIYMLQKSVRERVAITLLMLMQFYNSSEIQLDLTRQELASLAGTVQETLVRLFAEFKKDKIIELKNRSLKILDEKALIKATRV